MNRKHWNRLLSIGLLSAAVASPAFVLAADTTVDNSGNINTSADTTAPSQTAGTPQKPHHVRKKHARKAGSSSNKIHRGGTRGDGDIDGRPPTENPQDTATGTGESSGANTK